jgi:hypothetical protein
VQGALVQRQVRRALLALVAAAALVPVLAAPADAASLSGLHDARYCEIIALKGTPPTASATVWNTIGLNRCPPRWWKAFDAVKLAKELGATVVVLNGPRHFLMDSVTANPGKVRSFHGERLRRVATIPIRTAADLKRAPYADRTIKRDNTWRWKRGRLVYELVAPGGDVYVMQAYSQIVDPKQRIGDLRSLGKRLALPEGWRYRVRRLRHGLAIGVEGGAATIVQDELQNTYQLAKSTRPAGPRKRHNVSLTAATRNVPSATPGTLEDRGTIMGTPFGRGKVTILASLANMRLTGTFRQVFPRGSVYGTADMAYTIAGNEIHFRGAARFTGGTGAFRGITSGDLVAKDDNTLDGQNGVVSLKGSATY